MDSFRYNKLMSDKAFSDFHVSNKIFLLSLVQGKEETFSVSTKSLVDYKKKISCDLSCEIPQNVELLTRIYVCG